MPNGINYSLSGNSASGAQQNTPTDSRNQAQSGGGFVANHYQQQPYNEFAHQMPQQGNGLVKALGVLTAVVVLAVGGMIAWNVYSAKNNGSSSSVLGALTGSNEYQAVFLNQGQVFFGKIKSETDDKIVLTDAYFIQVNMIPAENQSAQAVEGENGEQQIVPQNQAEAKQELSIVPRTGTLHSPDGEMTIYKEQIIFVEKLKPESKVIEAINTLKNGGAEQQPKQ